MPSVLEKLDESPSSSSSSSSGIQTLTIKMTR
eukprot:CAMPEP_0172447564 /NCGR_PEP_ID=MMETSP1065-20121228/6854_1 /TAXON_ID=265537 /ORGANISM="Amphiprora paludosa, Strain CCMP125" /LENGTH=31 /DNA_ID= /DNA_START= /DNA_END= /DNA_ORIENTATION=